MAFLHGSFLTEFPGVFHLRILSRWIFGKLKQTEHTRREHLTKPFCLRLRTCIRGFVVIWCSACSQESSRCRRGLGFNYEWWKTEDRELCYHVFQETSEIYLLGSFPTRLFRRAENCTLTTSGAGVSFLLKSSRSYLSVPEGTAAMEEE